MDFVTTSMIIEAVVTLVIMLAVAFGLGYWLGSR